MCVADKFTLFIVVDGLTADGCQYDAEDDEHCQPDLPHKGGVVGDLIQQTSKEAPTHGAKVTGELNELWVRKRQRIDIMTKKKRKKKKINFCFS